MATIAEPASSWPHNVGEWVAVSLLSSVVARFQPVLSPYQMHPAQIIHTDIRHTPDKQLNTAGVVHQLLWPFHLANDFPSCSMKFDIL